MHEVRGESLARERFLTTLLLLFASVGLALAVVGVYGVMAQMARRRSVREMGIRLALGAQANDVRWLVVRNGLRLVVTGLVIGVSGCALATKSDADALVRRRVEGSADVCIGAGGAGADGAHCDLDACDGSQPSRSGDGLTIRVAARMTQTSGADIRRLFCSLIDR